MLTKAASWWPQSLNEVLCGSNSNRNVVHQDRCLSHLDLEIIDKARTIVSSLKAQDLLSSWRGAQYQQVVHFVTIRMYRWCLLPSNIVRCRPVNRFNLQQ